MAKGVGANGPAVGFVRGFAALLLSCALAGCEPALERFEGPTMGSRYSVQYVGVAGLPSRDALQGEVETILGQIDRDFSTYRGDSQVSRFNAAPAGTCQAMPDEVLELARAGAALSRESDGAFDLTLEPLLDLWGFGPQSRGERVPTPAEIDAVRQRVGHRHLRIEARALCKDVALQLDFNAIAAGYTVDRVAARLEALGVKNFLVEITGELKAQGHRPDGSPWRIGIEAPHADRREAQRRLALDGQGVSTSGDYRHYFERDGRRYSHTLDPATGAPIRHALASVTVVAPSALRADGLSTLLMVLGPRRGLAYAERQGIAALFVSHEGEGFVERASSAFDRLPVAGP
ncbi:FAD:protein FMN transferase [Pseudomonas sp. RIT-PI-AD]|uniref:FAD:protein FMN transferase n=1 Tax=Pseudomonas sp. RIT-PI-AD TaxID=3035294 RepID=UPI0021D7DC84|nr:FAD:protein FMN transferase [Pseudomonas sp. RIT-PI-AD]